MTSISKNGHAFKPSNLFDCLISIMKLKNDAALSQALGIGSPIISKIRHNRLPVSASLLLRIHDVTQLPVRDLRDFMGDRRQRYRTSTSRNRS
jgi:hypothetical protein